MTKKKTLSLITLSLLLISISVFYFKKKQPTPIANLNTTLPIHHILILSFCSVSTNQLPFFGNADIENFPNLKRILSESYAYKNAYTSLSWSNIKRSLFRRAFNEKYNNDLEFTISSEQTWTRDNHDVTFLRVPEKEDLQFEYLDYFTDKRLTEPFENFDNMTKKIISHVTDPAKSNIVLVHFKMMHYPYLGEKYLTDEKIMNKTFTSDELKLIKKYTDNPAQYPDKLPFFQVTFGTEKIKKLLVNKDQKFLDVSTNIESNNKWKNSPDFKTDMAILKKAYNLRLKDFDQLLGKYYEFYQKELETKYQMALVLTGDHGEALLEHDYLTHASTPYDEVLHYFQSIHFPKQKFNKEILEQSNQSTTADLIEKLIKNRVTINNFETWQNESDDNKIILGYSCNMDMISARMEGKWKLIYWFNTGESKLFNLENDPAETIDVSDKYPDIAADLRIEINNRLTDRKLADNECIH